jgi:hypothetical protein
MPNLAVLGETMRVNRQVQAAMRQAAKAAGQRQLSGIDSMFRPFATKYEPPAAFEANAPWHCRHKVLMFRPCNRCGRTKALADAVWGKRINQLLAQAKP